MFFFLLNGGFSIFHYSIAGKTEWQISENQTFEETQTLLLTPKNLGMYLPFVYTKTVFMPTSSLYVATIF